MLKIKNNPIDVLLEIFEENYYEASKKINNIMFADFEGKDFAMTFFYVDEENRTIVDIYLKAYLKKNQKKPIPLEVCVELLAHELAHVVVGMENKHNEEWEKVFEDLHIKFEEKMLGILERKILER